MMRPSRMVLIRGLAGLSALGIILYALWAVDSLTVGAWLALLLGAGLLLVVTLRPDLPVQVPDSSRAIVRTAAVFAALFALLSVQLIRLQVLDAPETYMRSAYDPAMDDTVANPRRFGEELDSDRGSILAANGEVIAETVRDGDSWRRVYPDAATAQVAGYYSPLLYGAAGLEGTYDLELSGAKGGNPIDRVIAEFLHHQRDGLDIVTTIDPGLQRQAVALLGNQAGAVVIINIKTGAVVALASAPTFDPNQLFTTSGAENATAKEYWDSLNDSENDPLLVRSTSGLYPPGSTYKTISAAGAIEYGISDPETIYEDTGVLEISDRTLTERNRPDDSVTEFTLRDGYAYSLNLVFAQVGLQLGGDRLWDISSQFGIGRTPPIDVYANHGQIADDNDSLDSPSVLADTAFGQGELLVTPLQMALVAAAVANDGVIMTPYLVDHVVDIDNMIYQQHDPSAWLRAINRTTARQMQDLMEASIDYGWASSANLGGYLIGGKTGTAENPTGNPHSWFIGYIGESEPEYAIAVIVEYAGEGGQVALPIARELMQGVMRRD